MSKQDTVPIRCHKREKSHERELEKVDHLCASHFGEETLRKECAEDGDKEAETDTVFRIAGHSEIWLMNTLSF